MSGQPFLDSVSRQIWQTKYRYCDAAGGPEEVIEDTWRRVAAAAASVEPGEKAFWEQRFFRLLVDFRFLPGGRILAGAGTANKVTLFNCFVMGPIEDSLDRIFDALKEGALTMQQGGGIGCDFSNLRPQGVTAQSAGTVASGPVSFMGIWDSMCATLLSTGSRRGAMMATLRCDHPDIERFIEAKRDPRSLRHFNLSVLVSDAFMAAVEEGGPWPLVFPLAALSGDSRVNRLSLVTRNWPGNEDAPVVCAVLRTVPARALWERLMRAAYDSAEPGVLFIDRINRWNNLGYCEHITATNPCGEIPLPPYGACNLGSVNLARFVENPFSTGARLDLAGIAALVATAVRLLDNIIDVSGFPLEAQRGQARATRRIGLGITGLADALIMLGLRYDEPRARELAASAMSTVCHQAYRASIELSVERGCFALFDPDAYLSTPFVAALPEDIRHAIRRSGIRNSHLTAIAPAGTISLLANNVSSGVEPVFELDFSRRILERDGTYREHRVTDFAVAEWRRRFSDAPLPAHFVTSTQLAPESHLAMQAVLQSYADSAISKTINVPEDYPFEDFRRLYLRAYEMGLKGCTAFRPNPLAGAVLLSDGASAGSHCCSVDREAD